MDYFFLLMCGFLSIGYIFSWLTQFAEFAIVGYVLMSLILLLLSIYFLTMIFKSQLKNQNIITPSGNKFISNLNMFKSNISSIIISVLSIIITSYLSYISIQYKKVLKHKNEIPQLNEFFIVLNILFGLFLVAFISYTSHHIHGENPIGKHPGTILVMYGLLFLCGLFLYMLYSTVNYYPTTDLYYSQSEEM